MFRASIAFFLLAIIAYVFGAYEVAGLSADIGKLLLWVFLIIAVISFVASLVAGKNPKQLL
jgi:uncharacterized membrane protein YtjA (UPF0391 family)